MKSIVRILLFQFIFLGIFLFQNQSIACSTFGFSSSLKKWHESASIQSSFYVGKSYDWYDESGMIITNKKGLLKRASNEGLGDALLAEWISRFSSITFNQFGHEFPMGGMNSQGLVVEVSWLNDSQFPLENPSNLPLINQLQWIQYILDTSRNVKEAIAQAKKVQVKPLLEANVHWMACDVSGDCASFEYLNQELVIRHQGQKTPVRSLTNDTYDSSMIALRKFQGFGGKKEVPQWSADSIDRFAIITKYGKNCMVTKNPVQCAFETLDRVNAVKFTRWQIVYDLKNRTVHYRTEKERTIKSLQINDFDQSCSSPVEFLDLNKSNLPMRNVKNFLRLKTPQNANEMLMQNKTLKAMPDFRKTILDYPGRSVRCEIH